MGLFRGVLLGTGAALVSIGAAQAADLPSRKAAPVEYVRVCDAYGAGFFFIPGTQTCLRIGGRVRADYAFSGRDDIYSGGTINGTTGALVDTISSLGSVQSTHGFEARGRINIDARTQTAWGTVQAAAQLRMARTTGVLQSTNGNPTSDSGSTGSTLESAFIRFAGFTFGISRDNFASMPSLTYGAGHWAAFGNGAMQLTYTHTFGGGLSATVGIQDRSYTTAGGTALTGTTAIQSNYEGLPQFNARLDWAQSWGEIALTAAVGEARGVTSASSAAFDDRETVWAVGGALKLNLPMLASGSALWLTGAYADGMTEYTTNFTSVKTSDTRRNVGGYTSTHPSWVYSGTEIQTYTSWNVAALLQHFWTPQWRSVAWASYGQINAPAGVAALPFNASAPADATVWNIGKQIAWLPTRDFEIGLEVIYSRVDQDVGRTLVAGTGGSVCAAGSTACFTREHSGNFTGRLRVERNF